MKTVTISSLASEMAAYWEANAKPAEPLIIPENKEESQMVILSIKEYNALTEDEIMFKNGSDQKGMVLLPLSEYNALLETQHLLSSKTNTQRLEETIQQLEKGETIPYTLEN